MDSDKAVTGVCPSASQLQCRVKDPMTGTSDWPTDRSTNYRPTNCKSGASLREAIFPRNWWFVTLGNHQVAFWWTSIIGKKSNYQGFLFFFKDILFEEVEGRMGLQTKLTSEFILWIYEFIYDLFMNLWIYFVTPDLMRSELSSINICYLLIFQFFSWNF